MKEQLTGAYIILQFLGFLLQVLPMLFLVYTPFQPSVLRFPRRRFLALFCAGAVCFYGAEAVYLGTLYYQGIGWDTVVNQANLIFAMGLFAGSLVYFLGFRMGVRGKTFLYLIIVQYGICVHILNKLINHFIDSRVFGIYPYSPETVISYTVVTLLSAPLLYRFLKYGNVQELLLVNPRALKMITFCSVAMLGLFILSIQMENNLALKIDDFRLQICLCIWMVCFLVGCVMAYGVYFGCLILEKEKEEMHLKLSSYEQQYKWMREGIEQEKRARHNLRHHLRTMNALVENGDVLQLKNYIGNCLFEVEESEERKISGNPCLDKVLSYYVGQAENRGIEIRCSIIVFEDYPFDMVDMTVLFGNALENALNACEKCGRDRAFIHLMVRQFKKSILIKIENSVCDGTGREFVRSYGMDSIDTIAKKYQGSMEAWIEQKKFVLRVVLNLED